MMAGNLLIAIPMKDPTAAKTRLAATMDMADRQKLAEGLFIRTLDVIGNAGCDVSVLVVTESAAIARMCRGHAVDVLLEETSEGLNTACQRAADWALHHGYERLAILPADLALLSRDDIRNLAAMQIEQNEIAICEATDGGTNCLMLSPPNALAFQYGAGSFRAHRRQAMAEGLVAHVLVDSDMRFDIDTSDDLVHLRGFGKFIGASA